MIVSLQYVLNYANTQQDFMAMEPDPNLMLEIAKNNLKVVNCKGQIGVIFCTVDLQVKITIQLMYLPTVEIPSLGAPPPLPISNFPPLFGGLPTHSTLLYV